MLTRSDMVTWVRDTSGPDGAEERVRDAGHAFVVNLHPDSQDAPMMLVLKRTGEYWHVAPDASVLAATSEKEMLLGMKDAYLDPRHPFGTIAPAAPPVTRPQVVSWLARRFGWRHLDDRITDLGWMYLVNAQPDDFLDGTAEQDQQAGPVIVVKESGAVWSLPWAPELVAALGAASEQEFHDVVSRAGHTLAPDAPHDWPAAPAPTTVTSVPDVTRDQVAEWVTSQGQRHVDRRIADLGWAFSVDTQPDEYHDGDQSTMTYGNGPTMIVKRTWAYWRLSSSPIMLPVYDATDEQQFYKLMASAEPFFDRDRPDGLLPGRPSA